MKKLFFIFMVLSIGLLRLPLSTPVVVEKQDITENKELRIKKLTHLEISRINSYVNNYEVSYYSYHSSIKYGVPVKLILSIIKVESEFKNVVSKRNKNGSYDFGFMQVNNVAHPEYTTQELMTPEKNIEAGTKYLSYCLKKSNGNINTALKMYNAGVGRVLSGNTPPSSIAYAAKVTNALYSIERVV